MATSSTVERVVEEIAPREERERTTAAARERAYALVDREKKRVGGELTHLARALENAAGSLRQEHGDAAWLAGEVASRLGEVARAIDESDLGALGDRLRDLARRRPLALFAGSVAAGLLLTRGFGRGAGAGGREGREGGESRRSIEMGAEPRPLEAEITDAPLTAGYGGMPLEEP